jgi:hypothetical protein
MPIVNYDFSIFLWTEDFVWQSAEHRRTLLPNISKYNNDKQRERCSAKVFGGVRRSATQNPQSKEIWKNHN